MLIVRAEVPATGNLDRGLVDVRIAGGVVAELGVGLSPRRDEPVVDAAGGALLPGLHDHHLHLRAAAAARSSIDATHLTGDDDLRRALAAAAASRPAGTWLRVIGWSGTDADDVLDRPRLDACSPPGVPIRVQHRSGGLWVLNSAACRALDLDTLPVPGVDAPRGHLWRRDDLLRSVSGLTADDLATIGEQALARGVTGFTDATPDGAPTHARDLARDLRRVGVRQRLHLMGPVGATPPDVDGATLGPVKVLLDDDALPDLPELVHTMQAAHADDRAVAVHCVTRVQLVLTLAALDEAGPRAGDRIEHGSVIPAELIDDVARLGLTVVSQPHFVAERGDDYRRAVDADDLPALYRLRSLADAGIAVAAGTDAPFGDADPWPSVAAAVERRTRAGAPLGGREALDVAAAVDLYLGPPDAPGRPRRVRVGAPADLCLLSVSWRDLPAALGDVPVVATFVAGDLAFLAR